PCGLANTVHVAWYRRSGWRFQWSDVTTAIGHLVHKCTPRNHDEHAQRRLCQYIKASARRVAQPKNERLPDVVRISGISPAERESKSESQDDLRGKCDPCFAATIRQPMASISQSTINRN